MIDLVVVGGGATPRWPHGRILRPVDDGPSTVRRLVDHELARSDAEAWLFWDSTLGTPDAERIRGLLSRTGDVWHAGLRLGMAGLPSLLDTVSPTWMLNRDPDPAREATSWRLSLRACLVRTAALRAFGGLEAGFRSLDAAGLELGHRLIERGAFVRHVPDLIPSSARARPPRLELDDELRFVRLRYGARWSAWAAARAAAWHPLAAPRLAAAWRDAGRAGSRPRDVVYESRPSEGAGVPTGRVTVLVPTVHRYPYLRTLLGQLREQTVPPHEIIVIDQSPAEVRDLALERDFADLPLTVLLQDAPGQCTSRNSGLECATGEYVLFLDDDDEVGPTVIEDHLRTITRFGADSCSGIANEVGAGAVPEAYRFLRVSNVFPTNNTLVRRDALVASGLFDLAYNRAQKADGDLGMRLYLTGALMVLDPSIAVLHHHAPSGGLRVHKARVVTYASSRQSVVQRHLPSASEIYLAMRYFTPRQVREMLWQRAVGTFSANGSGLRRGAKLLVSGVRLPHTLWEIRARRRRAVEMLRAFPQIPELEPALQET